MRALIYDGNSNLRELNIEKLINLLALIQY